MVQVQNLTPLPLSVRAGEGATLVLRCGSALNARDEWQSGSGLPCPYHGAVQRSLPDIVPASRSEKGIRVTRGHALELKISEIAEAGLSILRERTNHLAGSIGMHWVTVAAMTLLIYLR